MIYTRPLASRIRPSHCDSQRPISLLWKIATSMVPMHACINNGATFLCAQHNIMHNCACAIELVCIHKLGNSHQH